MHENGAGVNSVPQYRGLRNDRFLYVRHDTTGEYELYDLRKDPYELHNVEDNDEYAGVKRAHPRLRAAALRRRGMLHPATLGPALGASAQDVGAVDLTPHLPGAELRPP